MQEEKLQQAAGEISFPLAFSYVPWGHHILIITKCKTIEEALFYIRHTIDDAEEEYKESLREKGEKTT